MTDDTTAERRRVAVQLALRTGLLKKCPVHDELYGTGHSDYQGALMVASFLINQSDPLVAPFGGDRACLGETLKTTCSAYGTGCPLCGHLDGRRET
ncbi:MAG TPA: hypothetical protein VM597_39080 [Gemmataceae bacterium]|jgi:hypothetical protein|nr:hypothetical protein [Gemmataceae bacterium]